MNRIICSVGILFLMFHLGGCSSRNPGTWTKEQIEARLKEELKLTEVSLKQNEDGSYSGSGQAADGKKYSLNVKQDEQDWKLEYEATDESGKLRGGFIKNYGR